jgi:putative DNA primase/helicase
MGKNRWISPPSAIWKYFQILEKKRPVWLHLGHLFCVIPVMARKMVKNLLVVTEWGVMMASNADLSRTESRELPACDVPDELQVVVLAEVTQEPVRWLWPKKIPLGKVTVVYGEAGLGKTSWSLDLAARVSAGHNWPDGAPGAGPAKVLLINGEDNLNETICPRLACGGAQLQNITAIAGIKSVTPEGETAERRFDLSRDIPTLRQRMEALGDLRLVLIDSLQACCGAVRQNSLRMRTLLAELGKLAEDLGVAIVVISAEQKCELPVKNVWRVDCDVLDPELRWWVPVKCHCSSLPKGMAFRVISAGIAWDLFQEPLNADRMSGSTGKEERTWRLRDLADWLTVQLTQGPCTAKEILRCGGAEGWSPGQIKRAKLALRVTCYKEKKSKGRWIWQLPAKPTQPVYHDAEPAPWPESGPEGKRSGVVVVDRIYGSARDSSQDPDPLAWLDRISNRGRFEVPQFKESKEIKENKEFKGTTENGALERGRSTAPELPGRDSMGG